MVVGSHTFSEVTYMPAHMHIAHIVFLGQSAICSLNMYPGRDWLVHYIHVNYTYDNMLIAWNIDWSMGSSKMDHWPHGLDIGIVRGGWYCGPKQTKRLSVTSCNTHKLSLISFQPIPDSSNHFHHPHMTSEIPGIKFCTWTQYLSTPDPEHIL